MRRILWLLLAFFLFSPIYAQHYHTVKDGPLHEAYAVQEYGTVLLDAIPQQPPANIVELVPKQDDLASIWIPGYWSWSGQYGRFLWASGVWRRPPPYHHWITGYWKESALGWIWIRGFWSAVTENEIRYTLFPPPDPFDEPLPPPPTVTNDYFWMPGYWHYDDLTEHYIWYTGIWTFPHPHWTYVPQQYIWREQGYVFVAPFWDWPMEYRGILFSSIQVDPEFLKTIIYEPENAIPHLAVMQLLFPNWPNYLYLFRFEYHFHQEAWVEWGANPPWWDWSGWWSFSYVDTWALWWWWSHPGYPNPTWIDGQLADMISPAPSVVVELMRSVTPPINMTARGVVGTKKILQTLATVTGSPLPILPIDPQKRLQIQEIALPEKPKLPILEPKGSIKVVNPPPKPYFGPAKQTIRHMQLPPIPPDMPVAALAQVHQPTPTFTPEMEHYEMVEPHPPTRLPPRVPQAQRPSLFDTPLPDRPIPQSRGPLKNLPPIQAYYPPRPSAPAPPGQPLPPSPTGPAMQKQMQKQMQQQPPYQNQYPGDRTMPKRRYRLPMQAEHHDFFMSHPMPQVNPEGPGVNEVPGDYSTLPAQ